MYLIEFLFSGQTLTEAGYNKFAAGEPNNLPPDQFCGGIYVASALLVDIYCDKTFGFFCEKNPGPAKCHGLSENTLY